MADEKIRAIVKRPDEEIGHVTNISPTLKNLQSIVGEIVVVGADEDEFCDLPGWVTRKEWASWLV